MTILMATMSSSLWNWATALVGVRPSGEVFLPTYWSLPAVLTAPSGWIPPPALVLGVLALLSILGVALFVRRKHPGYLGISCAIWGALLADTPHAIWIPLILFALWVVVLRIAKFMKIEDFILPDVPELPWRFLRNVYLRAFLVIFATNFMRTGVGYVPGYARNALSAIRWEGGWHFLDKAVMDDLLDEYVTEIARESDGVKWIFTDGLCDAGIELKGPARAVSLVGGAQGESYWRGLGFSREEDLLALGRGSGSLMRAWAVDHPGELTNAAFQCGFTFLEKEAADKLDPYGLILRSPIKDAKARAQLKKSSTEKTQQLADALVKFYREGRHPAHGGRIRQARFCSMQWRVARAMRRLAREFDREVRTEDALAATALSEELDSMNPYAHRMGEMIESADLRAFSSLTPREGLAFALKRANFAMARHFALPIIKDNPNNPEANFALAMNHLALREHAQARHYFQIALKASPNDATLLNNLAVTSMMLGDFADAEEKAQAALKQKPDSQAIKDTLRKIKLAKAEKEQEQAKEQAKAKEQTKGQTKAKEQEQAKEKKVEKKEEKKEEKK